MTDDVITFPPKPNPGEGTVLIAEGFELYREVSQHLKMRGYNVDVTVSWSDERAQLVVSRLEVRKLTHGEPVTSEALRGFAMQGFLRRALWASIRDGLTPMHLASLDEGEQGPPLRAWGLISVEDAEACKAAGPAPSTLEAVARIYRGAVALGDPPTKAVRETFEVSQSTAGAWVAAARKAGLLSAADGRGKASV